MICIIQNNYSTRSCRNDLIANSAVCASLAISSCTTRARGIIVKYSEKLIKKNLLINSLTATFINQKKTSLIIVIRSLVVKIGLFPVMFSFLIVDCSQ